MIPVGSYVYRLFDTSGGLLYIGMSANPELRIKSHSSKSWGARISGATLEGPYPRSECERVEHDAILAERPAHNVASKFGLRAVEIAHSCNRFEPPPANRRALSHSPHLQQLTISEAAKALGVSIQTLRRWEAQGKISARRTLGGQRRFAQSEIDRAKAGAR